MKIYFTFDYELYFGKRTGSVQKCILDPTDRLSEVADKHGVKLCHFVDIGFLLRLQHEMQRHEKLIPDYEKIVDQLKSLVSAGHDLQLHIHPHWEDSYFDGTRWVCRVNRYKLSDFNSPEAAEIFNRYHKALQDLTGPERIIAFRAGGWCIQPFSVFEPLFRRHGIKVDSSVFCNGAFNSDQYSYDFKTAPFKDRWRFTADPIKEQEEGDFTELPITSIFNSPLFYWRLFLLGRLFPNYHKPLGDGVPVAAPGQRFAMLTRWTYNTVSVDGYNAGLLNRALHQQLKSGRSEMVIIGHPKALTRYGIKAMDNFIARNNDRHEFTTFIQEKDSFT